MIRDDDKKPDLLIGRNAVTEALKSDREIDTLILMRNNNNPALSRLASMAKEKGAVVKEVDSKKLDFMCGGANHQGVAAYVAAHEYASVEDIFAYAEEKGEAPFIVVCDEIEYPRERPQQGRAAVYHYLRRDRGSAQPRCDYQNSRVCRRARRNHSEKAQCVAQFYSRQDFGRCARIYEGCEGI